MDDPWIDSLTARTEDEVFDAMFVVQAKQQPRDLVSFQVLVEEAFAHLGGGPSKKVRNKLAKHTPGVTSTDDYRKLASAAWRFVSAGLAFPVLEGSGEHRLGALVFTAKGHRAFAERDPEKNPHRPGYITRLMNAQPRINEEVFARLLDASDCIDAGLARPAVVMLGIAAEVTTYHAYETLRKKAYFTASAGQFKENLNAVEKHYVTEFAGDADKQHRMKMALSSIECLRVLRNSAAHPGNKVIDPYVAQERIGSACLQLPEIWHLLIIPNLPPPTT